MKVSFNGIGEQVVTFYSKDTAKAKPGAPVKISSAGEVSSCADGDRFCGICVSEKEGFAAVQTGGYVTAVYAGTAPAVGYGRLAAGGGDTVKTAASTAGAEYLIVEVDTAANTVGFFL